MSQSCHVIGPRQHPEWITVYVRILALAAVSAAGLAGCALAPGLLPETRNTPTVIRAQSAAAVPEWGVGRQPNAAAADSAAPGGPPVLVLSLRDAVELALEHSDVVQVLQGRVRLSSQTVYDQMIAAWQTQAEVGEFQPSITSRIEGSQVDEPPNAFFGPGIAAQTRRDMLDFNVRLTQPLKTGGELSVGIEPPLAYLYFPEGVDPDEFNPSWSTAYVFRFRQPLLRGHGRDVVTAPIQVAQLQTNQSRWALQEELNALIRSVIEAYWELYTAYVELQAVEAVIPMAAESVRIEQLRYQAEETIYADVARAEYQLEEMRLDAIRARAEIRRRTIQLRQLIGGPTRLEPLLFPADTPIEESPATHADGLIATALQQRPELNLLRERVNQRGVELNVARNGVLPQVDFLADYRASGLKERLDTSLGQAQDFDYTDWKLGVSLDVPLGNLTARSRQHAAEIRLTRDRRRLRRQEDNVAFEIIQVHSDLQAAWESFEVTTRQAVYTQQWLKLSRIRYSSPPPSGNGRNWLLLELSDFQRAMTAWVDAATSSGESVARYNIQLARLEEASGTAVSRWTTLVPTQPSRHKAPQPPPGGMSGRYGHTMSARPVGPAFGAVPAGGDPSGGHSTAGSRGPSGSRDRP